MRLPLLLLLCLPAVKTLRAQDLTIGVIAGTNLTGDVRSGRQTAPGGQRPDGQMQTTTFVVDPGSRRPIVGLQLDLRLHRQWSIEFDALHREWKSTSTFLFSPPLEFPDGRTFSTFGLSRGTLTTWEFPLLAKYRLRPRGAGPFLVGGPSFRPAGSGTQLSHVGVTAGGGFEFQAGGFRFSPALRYTRWAEKPSGLSIGAGLLNQIELVAGIDRPSTSRGVHAFGRRLSLGVVTGIGLGRDFRIGTFNQTQQAEGNSGMFGAMIEAELPKNLAIEVNGLYRALHGSDLEFNRRVRFAHLTWEFPVLLKYRFAERRRLRPLVAAGPSFRAEGNLNLRPVSHFGGTVAAGVEARWHALRVSPMVRYTRWGESAERHSSQTWANQTQLLVSFAF